MNEYKSDINELTRLITLDPQPSSAQWSIEELPGGSDWTLWAIISYTSDQYQKMLESMSEVSTDVEAKLPEWVSDDVRVELTVENGVLLVSSALEPVPYYSSPLLDGFAIALKNNQMLLFFNTQ